MSALGPIEPDLSREVVIDTPRWAKPLQAPKTETADIVRYRGAYGGRSSGKSHEFATMVVEEMVADKDCSVVCIREIQKSLDKSAKKLIVSKINKMGMAHLFDVQKTEIRRIGGTGVCIFVGMQDHTAESVKSLEAFHIAWVEEAESLSQFSMDLLVPTIREPRPWCDRGPEIWFTWNPKRRNAPVEKLLRLNKTRTNSIVVNVNYTQNPFCPQAMIDEANEMLALEPDKHAHIWLGGYETLGSKTVIPLAWINSAIGLAEDLGLSLRGRRVAGLDVAGAEDGGDANSLAVMDGQVLDHVEIWNGLDTSLTTQKASRTCVDLYCTLCFYDSVSVGEGVTGEWASMGRRGEQPEGLELHPWSGGASVLDPDEKIEKTLPSSPTNKEQYHNMKAQAYFSAARRFRNAHLARLGKPYDIDHIISINPDIPDIEELKDELSQPQHKLSGTGKTLVDKQPDGAPSPNRADSVIQAAFPCEEEPPAIFMALSSRNR